MSTDSITIKPNNHRVYQCPSDKKIELLNKLIAENDKVNIIVVCSANATEIKEALLNKEIRVLEDKEFIQDKELRTELLLSYDLPKKAIIYMARIAKATQNAFVLLDEVEQNDLYQVEMLLGRAIKQDVVEGFEYAKKEVVEKKYLGKKLSQDEIKEVARKRYEEKTQDAPKREYEDKPKRDFKSKDGKPSDDKWAKKKKAPNQFLGKDENGKAKFSGKSGERNHRHDGTPRDAYDAPKKVGRKINIKTIKPKESSEEK